MKNQLKTEGIILRRIALNEADQIITLLSPDMGKISCLVKGSRRLRSKFCGELELLAQITFSGFQGKDLIYMDDVRAVKTRPLTDTDLKTKSVLFLIAEITAKSMPEGQENAEIYALLADALDHVADVGEKREILLYGYLIKLMTMMGVMAPWERCSRSGAPLDLKEPLYLSAASMSVIRNGYQEAGDARLPTALIKWISFMQKSPLADLLHVCPSPGEQMQVWQIIISVFRNLVNHPLRSEAFLMRVR